MNKNYLDIANTLCSQCNKSLPISGNYVKCANCGSTCHYSPCSTLAESTYNTMNAEKKREWKCHLCRDGRKSPNNLYKAVVYDGPQQSNQQQNKQQRDEEDVNNTAGSKKFKDSLSLNSVNNNVCSLQNAVAELKNDMKSSIEQLTTAITSTITANNNIL